MQNHCKLSNSFVSRNLFFPGLKHKITVVSDTRDWCDKVRKKIYKYQCTVKYFCYFFFATEVCLFNFISQHRIILIGPRHLLFFWGGGGKANYILLWIFVDRTGHKDIFRAFKRPSMKFPKDETISTVGILFFKSEVKTSTGIKVSSNFINLFLYFVNLSQVYSQMCEEQSWSRTIKIIMGLRYL